MYKMSESIEKQVLNKIKKKPRGRIFFVESFGTISSAKTVNQALVRLVKAGELERIATGIYVRPIIDKYIGKILPSIEEIAIAIADRDRAIILPTGSFALYKLGLTTQVPLNIVYYSDTSARKIKIGNQTITFKKASSKSLAFKGRISKLAIQALRSIGKDKITHKEMKQIKDILEKENPKYLQHDLLLAPVWIRELITSTI
jgi:predicted transcriptional regulator of viral defense system